MNFSSEKKNLLLLVLIALAGFALRVFHLGLFPLWRDEVFTRYYSECPLSYLWTTGFRLETNPPAYYTLMHEWMRLFGTDAAGLRSLSVVCSTLTIVLVYALGRELSGRAVGLIAALLFALCPSEIWYAQEARTYALLQMMMALVLLGVAQFLARPPLVASLVLYSFGAVGCCYCHTSAIFLIAACNLAILSAVFGKSPLLTPPHIVRWLAVNTFVAVMLLPLLVNTWFQMHAPNLNWIPPLTPRTFLFCLVEVVAGSAAVLESSRDYPLLFMGVFAVALALLRQGDRRISTVLILVPVLFVVVAVPLSLRQSIFLPRVFLWSWIPLSLLVALILSQRSAVSGLVFIATLALFGVGLKDQYFSSRVLKEDWRNLSAIYPAQLEPSALIILRSGMTAGPLIYYHPELLSRLRTWLGEPAVPRPFIDTFLEHRFQIPEIQTNELLATIESPQPVALLIRVADRGWLAVPPRPLPSATHVYDDQMGNFILEIMSWKNDAHSAQAGLHLQASPGS
jgi:hypothetical protein